MFERPAGALSRLAGKRDSASHLAADVQVPAGTDAKQVFGDAAELVGIRHPAGDTVVRFRTDSGQVRSGAVGGKWVLQPWAEYRPTAESLG